MDQREEYFGYLEEVVALLNKIHAATSVGIYGAAFRAELSVAAYKGAAMLFGANGVPLMNHALNTGTSLLASITELKAVGLLPANFDPLTRPIPPDRS